MSPKSSLPAPRVPEIGFCREKGRLLGELLKDMQQLNTLLLEQTQAVVEGDPEFSGFDVLLHIAQEKKEQSKYRWIEHVEAHHCEEDEPMALTRAEKERITDSRLKLQSVTNSLSHVDPSKVPHFEAIQDCLEQAEESLGGALRPPGPDSTNR